jgi:hypothetical protein
MDTLERLPLQVEEYNKVIDYITLVAGEKYVDKICNYVPDFWGIGVAKKNESNLTSINILRKPRANMQQDAFSIAQLLWKEEVLDLLNLKGQEKEYKRKPRRMAWEGLVLAYGLEELKEKVREKLKSRTKWRLNAIQLF